MAFGYQGLILLNDTLFLVTNGNLDHERPILVSDGTYATANLNSAVDKVHMFDLDIVNGGFNFDTNMTLIDHLFDAESGWVLNRDISQEVLWYSDFLNEIAFGNVYWTRISLSAGSGNLLTTVIDVNMIPNSLPKTTNPDRYELPTRKLQLADNYIQQRFGLDDNGNKQLMPNIAFDCSDVQAPIPYWQTSIEFVDKDNKGLPKGVYVSNWSLEITNNITYRNLCCAVNNSDYHPGPSLIQLGSAGVTLNVTLVTVDAENDFKMPERFKDVIIKIQNESESRSLHLNRLDASTDGNIFSNPMQEFSDSTNISGAGSLQEMNYVAKGFFAMPHLV